MREIKIRGFSAEKLVSESQWVYGFGVLSVPYVDGNKDIFLYTDGGDYLVVQDSVGQYTGLKDKNGKEIYEGDLLKNNELWEVRYVPTLARFMMINAEKYDDNFQEENMSAFALMEFEVVGNVFENPDWNF